MALTLLQSILCFDVHKSKNPLHHFLHETGKMTEKVHMKC